MRLSGAEILARVLIEQGVDTVFGYPGGAVLPIYDALYDHQDTVTHYLTAHEQGAAHAADGYARATGKVGVVLATSGPGATNIVTGIACAFMDSVPLVAITGNVGTAYIGRDSFQEVYTTGITLPITKHNFAVQDVRELAETLRSAFSIASSGRKGPVLVDITKDAQAAWCEWEPLAQAQAPLEPQQVVKQAACFTQEDISAAAKAIAASEKPVVVFGGGIISAEATTELHDFIHAAQIPAAHSLMGVGALDGCDPLSLGLIGMHGKASANHALAEADLVLALGFRFSDRVALDARRWAAQARIIQVDIDPSEVNKNVAVDQAVVGDVREVLLALLPLVQMTIKTPRTHSWLSQIDRWRADDYQPLDDDDALKPHQLMAAIAELAGDEAIFTTDVGQHQMWAAQFGHRTHPRSFITSGGLGAMGFGYGAAIGAQIGAAGGSGRRQPVIHITGDGSFHMNLNEACTAVSYRLPIITVILNNQALGMVRQWQKTFYDARYLASTPKRATDFVKLAEGFGLVGLRAETLDGFRAAFARALTIDGPVWIECLISGDEQVLPMIPAGGAVADIIIE
ncbi:MAG: biosynthetic-type acetolactate synthase large subunit [Coriobacteriia bacterium]|nr:biosynthetic-type acetolactate synthase large subunit [Coriobacteriia bacterium]